MAIVGIGHLALVVSDMKRSAEFCTGILGFQKVHDLLDDNGRPWIVYFKVGKNGCYQCWVKDPDGNRNELMQVAEGSALAAHIG